MSLLKNALLTIYGILLALLRALAAIVLAVLAVFFAVLWAAEWLVRSGRREEGSRGMQDF